MRVGEVIVVLDNRKHSSVSSQVFFFRDSERDFSLSETPFDLITNRVDQATVRKIAVFL